MMLRYVVTESGQVRLADDSITTHDYREWARMPRLWNWELIVDSPQLVVFRFNRPGRTKRSDINVDLVLFVDEELLR